MAGSYNHCIDGQGRLLNNEDLVGMLENGGDVYEAVEEMYGMIWWLAHLYSQRLHGSRGEPMDSARVVEQAREHYQQGLEMSPGTDGGLEAEDIE